MLTDTGKRLVSDEL